MAVLTAERINPLSKTDQLRGIDQPLTWIALPHLFHLCVQISHLVIYKIERWSPKEIAIFECTLCAYGKKFELALQLLGQSKDLRGITEFYHLWKQTSHYRVWKEAGRN